MAEELRAGIATSTCDNFFLAAAAFTNIACDHYTERISLLLWTDICRRRRVKQSKRRSFCRQLGTFAFDKTSFMLVFTDSTLVFSADAIVVVSTSLVDAQAQIERSSPHLKASLLTHSKDVVIVIDKALKNPLVITGVTKFAKAQGIPHAEALLRVASLALNKVLVIIDEEAGKAKEDVERIKSEEEAKLRAANVGSDAVIVEYDAEELQRTATTEAVSEAGKVGKIAEEAQHTKDQQPEASTSKGKGKAKEKDDKCIIM